MNFRFGVFTLIWLLLLLAGVMIIEDRGGNAMTKTEHLEEIHTVLPPIDKNVPAVIETATFALG